MSYLATDPALVVLYKQLRDKSLQTLKGATEITPRAEWDFVMQTARLYDRMGCDLLALDLGKLWKPDGDAALTGRSPELGVPEAADQAQYGDRWHT